MSEVRKVVQVRWFGEIRFRLLGLRVNFGDRGGIGLPYVIWIFFAVFSDSSLETNHLADVKCGLLFEESTVTASACIVSGLSHGRTRSNNNVGVGVVWDERVGDQVVAASWSPSWICPIRLRLKQCKVMMPVVMPEHWLQDLIPGAFFVHHDSAPG